MTFGEKLLGFEGRLRRRDWWLLSILLFIFQAVVTGIAAVLVIGPQEMIAESRGMNTHVVSQLNLLTLGINLLLMWPAMALIVKRRHDRDGSGSVVVSFYIAALVLTYLPVSLLGGGAAASALLVIVSGLANLGIGLTFLIVLGLLDGTPGPNGYGPSPKDEPAPFAADRWATS